MRLDENERAATIRLMKVKSMIEQKDNLLKLESHIYMGFEFYN